MRREVNPKNAISPISGDIGPISKAYIALVYFYALGLDYTPGDAVLSFRNVDYSRQQNKQKVFPNMHFSVSFSNLKELIPGLESSNILNLLPLRRRSSRPFAKAGLP